ncbi:hypothetical protein P9314_04370 [Paenibacillus validus]|uniref:tyrosine-type recombinase/integrase n=1 Tax=Paenibacillus validus TaxID=44253 RepID=UPI001FD54CE4|nr:hypothetical protein [Paenibacillus validus]MED4599943.1 hypothetical protein [Paenibacillus validus]MED4605885.1 hypothetical protein [Paenibacillus validus]
MASIEKRGPNSYRLIVEAGYDANGKRIKKMKTVRTNTKKEAMSELAKFQIEVEVGEYISPEKITLSTFVDEWKEKHAARNLAPSTMKVYMEHIRQHTLPKFGHLQINQIRTIQVVTFIDDLSKSVSNSKPLSDSTVLYICKVLKHLLNKAVEWRLLQKNPIDGVKQPKVQRKKMNYYDEKEARDLIAALSNRQKTSVKEHPFTRSQTQRRDTPN